MIHPAVYLVLISLACGYLVGFQHRSDRDELAVKRDVAPVLVPVASPHASTCSAMLEAAWAIEDVPPKPSP